MPRPERVHAGNQIRSRFDVASRVQQRRNRGRRIHGLGDPGVQRIHDRLGHGRHDHQQGDAAGKRRRDRRVRPQESSCSDINQHDRGEQSVAGEVGDDQHLARPVCGGTLLVPEADQKIGAQADDLPREVGQQQIGGAYQHHEAADEQQHQHVEACDAFGFLFHVSDGIEQDRRAHAGTEQHEKDAEAVHMIGEWDAGVPIEPCRRQDVALNHGWHHRQHRQQGNCGDQKRQPPLGRPRQDRGREQISSRAPVNRTPGGTKTGLIMAVNCYPPPTGKIPLDNQMI